MDDWQDTAFSNRHVHNRIGKKGRGKGGRGSAVFDVRKTFGTYELKCPAYARFAEDSNATAQLELYRLNEEQNAIFGLLIMPGVLEARVILAPSRKVMKTVINGLVAEMLDSEHEHNQNDNADESVASVDDDDDDDDDQGEEEEQVEERDTFQTFEKNSFRSPKFWLHWQGQSKKLTARPEDVLEDSGYVVFAGNDCKSFSGTLNCSELEWDNVKIAGHRLSSKSERNFEFNWLPHAQRGEA